MRGKNRLMHILSVCAAASLGASVLAADGEIKIMDVNAWDSGRLGGPFEVQPMDFGGIGIQGRGKYGASSNDFLTFCLEKNETIAEGKTYDAIMNTAAVKGGKGGPSPDPLDARSAFLYSAFLKGTLDDKLADAGYRPFNYGEGTSGASLQAAIWKIEDEPVKDTRFTHLARDLISLANSAVDVGGEWFEKGIGNVRVLNMFGQVQGEDRQDLLVMIPLPIPAALGLVGLVGIGIATRRGRVSAI